FRRCISKRSWTCVPEVGLSKPDHPSRSNVAESLNNEQKPAGNWGRMARAVKGVGDGHSGETGARSPPDCRKPLRRFFFHRGTGTPHSRETVAARHTVTILAADQMQPVARHARAASGCATPHEQAPRLALARDFETLLWPDHPSRSNVAEPP